MTGIIMTPAAAHKAILAGTAPDNLTVCGSLDFTDRPALTALPDGLTVNGWFGIYGCPALTALPDGLTVNGSLNVYDCPALTALGHNLTVSGALCIFRCPALPPLYTDARGYELRRVVLSDGEWFIAGCRKFRRAEAIAHWGSTEYPNQKRGAAFVAAINATGDA